MLYKTLFSSKLFYTTYYIDTNPDVKQAKINPLWHYINHGDKEGRKPNPFFDPESCRLECPEAAKGKDLNILYHYYKFEKMRKKEVIKGKIS